MVVGKNWNLGSLESWQVQHVKKEWCQVVIFFFSGMQWWYVGSTQVAETHIHSGVVSGFPWPASTISPLLFYYLSCKWGKYDVISPLLIGACQGEHSPPAARDAPDMHTFQSVLGLAALPTVIQTPGFRYGLLRHSTFFSADCISAAYPHLCYLGTS